MKHFITQILSVNRCLFELKDYKKFRGMEVLSSFYLIAENKGKYICKLYYYKYQFGSTIRF